MKKKHFLATLLAATVLSTGAVNAAYDSCDSCYDPCEMDSCFGGFEIGADFLYWKLCLDDLNYSTSYQTNFTPASTGTLLFDQSGTNNYLCSDWKPGFRVFLAKDNVFCDWDLIASYAWINHCNSSSSSVTENGVLQPTLIHPNALLAPAGDSGVASVSASLDVTYQTFDVLFASDYCFRQCHNFKPFFGVTGVFLDQDFNSSWEKNDADENSEGTTKWSGEYSGYGLKMGTEYSLSICDGFSMYANASGSITVGDQSSSVAFAKTDNDANTSWQAAIKEEECVFVPGYNIGVGFQYDSCLCDMEYSARLGYEFVQLHNVNNQRHYNSGEVSEFSSSSSSTLATLGYHGINVGVSVTF
ncbi:MAG: Lpg1974 family pore-forming outer membrane protein [Chlamydiota bacterium]|nr:Lpg1974 family pore-forming outer membrane protein [Chlamydiota bacterium]